MAILKCALLFLSVTLPLQGVEFIYPVCRGSSDNTLYILYQKSPHHIELWEWDHKTKEAQLALLTRFMPAGISALPDHSGFSFIDGATVKIKMNSKRSPKTIPLDEPLYDIRSMVWIDTQRAILSAKRLNNYGIFSISQEGNVHTLDHETDYDCVYPQIVGTDLFYVRRDTKTGRFCVHQRHMSSPETDTALVSFNFQPIAFLHMVNEHQGFVIGYPPHIERSHRIITFTCYRIIKDMHAQTWQYEGLFSFDIPTDFLFFDTSMRLHESMLPLLPRYYGETILFSHYIADKHGAFLRPFCYSLQEKTKTICSIMGTEQHYFAPFKLNDTIYFGGALDEFERGFEQLLFVDSDDFSMIKVHFPFIHSFDFT